MTRARIERRAVAGTLVLALLGVACGSSELGAKRRFVASTLEERAPGMGASVRDEVVRTLIRMERERGVDALLLLSVIEQESQYDSRARSPRGAIGLMQIRPATAREIADRHDISWDGADDLFDPRTNISLGAAYLARHHAKYGDWHTALAAYNMGPTKVRNLRARGKKVHSRYAERILARQRGWIDSLDSGE